MDRMKRPYMRFFTTDWRGDPRLRMCSAAARGLWIEMICLMHEAEPYGHLLVNGQPVSPQQLASLAGVPQREVNKLLKELETAGVYDRDGETIISRRMVRDAEKIARDKANGATGGNPTLKRGVNPQDKAHSPESNSNSPNPDQFKVLNFGAEEKWKPRHGLRSKKNGTIFLVEGTEAWAEYDADEFNLTGKRSIADTPAEGGGMGKWFKITGAAPIPPPKRLQQARA